ncbi:cupin domain-containing protein [Pseudomonas entomophila]|uniref:cupin domain-containing protein n=1 Tax=Pseudomonas entomophila TaxID=312306 RepID=UPI0020101FE2|nr:cupin domain-containing protein [Pseudomonas entomophila]
MRLLKVLLALAIATPLAAGANECSLLDAGNLNHTSIPTNGWRDVPGTNGAVRYVNVQGNILLGGPYMAYVRFRAGTDNGLHTHSQALATVVLKGNFYVTYGTNRIVFHDGGFYQLRANREHESGCAAGAECFLFQFQCDRFDLHPVSPPSS